LQRPSKPPSGREGDRRLTTVEGARAGFVCKFLDTKGKEIAQRIKDENAKKLFEAAVNSNK
jgi:hypothetical protein